MYRPIFSFALLLALSATAFASPESDHSQYSTPCNSWIYSTAANAFVCSSVGFGFTSADQQDVQQLQNRVQNLESKISQLEWRIQQLEQKP